jgi:uncharacterized phage protein gp47/JayE
MADLSDFLPIRIESIDTIIARIDADVNAGLDPGDDRFIDTTPGTFYADIRSAIALELERLWDVATTDTVAASLVEFAWGDYLDAHGETIGIERNDEVRATGEVTFTSSATASNVLIGTETEVSTIQTDPEEDPVVFRTTESDTIVGSSQSVTLAVEAVEPGSASNVATGAATLLLSPIDGIATVTNAASITGGADVETDAAYRERLKLGWSAAQGSGSVADYQRWSLDYPGVGFVRVTPLWNGPGTVRVVVTDVENNPVSDAIIEGLQSLLDPFTAETQVNGNLTSLPPTAATLIVDSISEFADSGQLYVGDYLVTYSGVTTSPSPRFTGVAGLPATVSDNTKVVQHDTGRGLAPVGAIVTVRTAQTVAVDVAAELTLREGYTLDGDSGTIAVQAEIEAVLTEFINNLPPGAEGEPGVETGAGFVLVNRIASLILRVPGVYDLDLSLVELDGSNANFVVGALEVPEIGTITLTTA